MSTKNTAYYRVPDAYWERIHFVRPRFKSNIENVLLYMANECCRIPDCSCAEYNKMYLNSIKMFPGNIDMSKLTLNNWRTEIPALFSFYIEDKELDVTRTSEMAKFLNEHQDLTQFLRIFLFSFQFPGGHLKPQELIPIISRKIKFKPAKSILQVLMAGNEICAESNSNKEMSISAEEATYCIFNDVRFTNGSINPSDVAYRIIENRKKKLKYYNPQDPQSLSLKGKPRRKSDMVRYAGDILDYMVIANLLEKHHGYYSLKGNEINAIKLFSDDKSFFTGYNRFYKKKKLDTSELASVEPLWFEYVNRSMRPELFKTDIQTILSHDELLDIVVVDTSLCKTIDNDVFEDRIKSVVSSTNQTSKVIGDLGEAIICGHEKMRLKLSGFEEYIRRVQIVDNPSYHPGYDIDSFEADGTTDHRYIEVKTTISKQRINIFGFHMSPNEWSVAGTNKEHYYIYRLFLSENEKVLYILRDPVRLYKTDKIDAQPRDGMEISFDNNNFTPTPLLTWKK